MLNKKITLLVVMMLIFFVHSVNANTS